MRGGSKGCRASLHEQGPDRATAASAASCGRAIASFRGRGPSVSRSTVAGELGRGEPIVLPGPVTTRRTAVSLARSI